MKQCSWTYTHHLNSKSSIETTKNGSYYGLVKHTCRYRGPQLAVVQFDGNKRTSRVPYDDLFFETIFTLDVDDAIVTVWEQRPGFWLWSFRYSDGSGRTGDGDWCKTEKAAKAEAVDRYRWKKDENLKRAKWIKQS